MIRSLFSSSLRLSSDPLKDLVGAAIEKKAADVKDLRKNHGDVVLGEHTVAQAYGGGRGIKMLVTETSLLDANDGIHFHGLSIPECQEKLPAADKEPLPEGMLWLLFTGQIPTAEQTSWLSSELASRAANIPSHVHDAIAAFPKNMHPMSQFSSAILNLQTDSKFAKAYHEGVHKSKYWEYFYEDALDLIARLPVVAAHIFNSTFRDIDEAPKINPSLDWGANFGTMMGFDKPEFLELMRLYLTIHSDHEGGNVSAHATHLVGSTLSDPYLSLSAGMNGLAGPLHGLANQEVLSWIKNLVKDIGITPTAEQIEKYCWDTLNSGRVIPGYGHAVLRKTDPRYSAQREFALKHMPDDDLFKIVSHLYDIVPGVLTKLGKVANPWPNVDAHSGVLLVHYGLVQEDFYTVMFGVSRALGVLPSLVWDRGLGLPIERPKSVTTGWIQDFVKKQVPK